LSFKIGILVLARESHETICKEIGKLTSLLELKLYDNSWTRIIPTELGCLTRLKELDIHQPNGVSGYIRGRIPSELGQLVDLEYLFLGWNLFSGFLPSEVL
jgi:hypothetical protein